MKMTQRRLSKEFSDIRKEDPPIVQDAQYVVSGNPFHWHVVMKGPEKTPYENGFFKLNVLFTTDHPFKPPKISFLTKIYHPNINDHGDICIDILKTQWSPALTMTKIILSISSMLCDPNPNDPLVQSRAELYLNNRDAYNKKAREWTERYAAAVKDSKTEK